MVEGEGDGERERETVSLKYLHKQFYTSFHAKLHVNNTDMSIGKSKDSVI